MSRWVAIVALLLGMGFTAFESFTAPAERESTVRTMEGGVSHPPPGLSADGTTQPPARSIPLGK
jgi:hypothetical protein